jgi:hypothetical protein
LTKRRTKFSLSHASRQLFSEHRCNFRLQTYVKLQHSEKIFRTRTLKTYKQRLPREWRDYTKTRRTSATYQLKHQANFPTTMMFTSAVLTFATILPAVWSLPTNLFLRQTESNPLATCGAVRPYHQTPKHHTNEGKQHNCVTDGDFGGCAPGRLDCLCKLEQREVTRYVTAVQPCLDASPEASGTDKCSPGGVYSMATPPCLSLELWMANIPIRL